MKILNLSTAPVIHMKQSVYWKQILQKLMCAQIESFSGRLMETTMIKWLIKNGNILCAIFVYWLCLIEWLNFYLWSGFNTIEF